MQDINDLISKLRSGSAKNQLKLITQLVEIGDAGYQAIMAWLLETKGQVPTNATGKAYQVIYEANTPETKGFLESNFPSGVVTLSSDQGVDYSNLQNLLAQREFERADVVTMQKLCELAGASAVERKWLYFTEVDGLPTTDLQTIDKLWRVHSEGKFGFSVQRKIWLSVGKDFTKLWPKIEWKEGNNWTRYPGEFTWDLSAPKGHLPLSNQLRGVRVIDAIFKHPAWEKK